MILASALTCLALNVYHEARGEPARGQHAVAMVTMNRASWDQRNVCKVVYQRKQFSWTHTIRDSRPKESQAWERALFIAREALLQSEDNLLHGATHYHATYVRPRWASSLSRVSQIGAHIFYRSSRPSRSATPAFFRPVPAAPGALVSKTASWLASFAEIRFTPSRTRMAELWARLKRGWGISSSIFAATNPHHRRFLCSRPRRPGSSGQSGINPDLIVFASDKRRPYETGAPISAD